MFEKGWWFNQSVASVVPHMQHALGVGKKESASKDIRDQVPGFFDFSHGKNQIVIPGTYCVPGTVLKTLCE